MLLFIPSPDQGVWHLGPVPIRAYALCIIAGVVAAVWLGERRWVARGGRPGQVTDLAMWAVPFGLVGARLYHVATDWELYFPDHPVGALEVWNGGLGIWGGIAGGFLGAAIGARRAGILLLPMADALAPTLLLAQAIGRWGNWFNQELFGRPTTLPWGLEIDPAHRPEGYADDATFHPTFLYECVWNLGALGLVLWADRRFRLGHGRVFALYVMSYTAGRAWIENLRIDSVQLDDVGGLRFNVWMSLVMFLAAAAYFAWASRARPGREEQVLDEQPDDPDADPAEDPAEDPVEGAPSGSEGTATAPPDRSSAEGPTASTS